MALVIEHEPKEITFSDSPQYIIVSDTNVAQFALHLTVWRGDKGTIPIVNGPDAKIFQLVQDGNSTGDATVTFQIDEFLETLIDFDDYIPTSSGLISYNEKNGVWYRATIFNGTEEKTVGINFATMGKGKYIDGVNPGTTVLSENGKTFGYQTTDVQIDINKPYLIPVYVGDTGSTNKRILSNGIDYNLVVAGATLNSTDSAYQIAYLSIDATLFSWVLGVSYVYKVTDTDTDTSIIDYVVRLGCFGDRPKSIKYINFSGSVSDLPINGADIETFKGKKTDYNNLQFDNTLANPYDVTKHVKKSFIVDSTQSFSIFTGWIFEPTNQMVRELLSSKRIWLEIQTSAGVEVYPSVITTSSKKMIRREYKHEEGYDLMLEVANQYLNKVV